jgi:hypothetical protein
MDQITLYWNPFFDWLSISPLEAMLICFIIGLLCGAGLVKLRWID